MNTKNIENREEFISFIDELKKDLFANKTEWENLTLEDYLEAIKGWMEDTNSLPSNPNWSTFAEILMSGKFYE
ncbi:MULTISPECIES: hypothetical protein [unclassified Bacillus (in: firmicutes)]|uniref:DUF7660 family protein n=1 Tax=unclassified Bacillus (in: firmicutes) TaxID=185979 RepID=UPI0008EE2175|nr:MULTISPECIES: hypothetical protein [unclassified Bacillus (in: firmicutes)]SFA99522.1 hypothetical protein SAMN02799634_103448 [Bacillus sp. UNCCL13]SFQ81693.1 hypothetical protein SAMN04488577_2079 [Bacillus sp. cl95]